MVSNTTSSDNLVGFTTEFLECTSDDLDITKCSKSTEPDKFGIFQIKNGTEENTEKVLDELCKKSSSLKIDQEKINPLLQDNFSAKVTRLEGVVTQNGRELNEIVLEINKPNDLATTRHQVFYDLTFYDPDNQTIEKTIQENRLQLLKNHISKLPLKRGDQFIIYLFGTSDYGDPALGKKNEVLQKKQTYILADGKNITYRYECNENKRKMTREISIHKMESVKPMSSQPDDIIIIPDASELISRVTKLIEDSYGEYSRGSYLVEALHNSDFLEEQQEEGGSSAIFSDFAFNLHPTMMNTFKIPQDDGHKYNFPPSDDSLRKNNSWYELFYKKNIASRLDKKCPNNNTVQMYGIRDNDDIYEQSYIKDFYSNILLKNCNLLFL